MMYRNSRVKYFQVAQGVWGLKLAFVNIYMIANRRGVARGWVLVDTGIKGSAEKIITMAETLFGLGTRPLAIVLTHGHPDHSGSVEELLKYWDVPVYAHPLELPYLTGESSHPPADPTVGGGLVSLISVFFNGKLPNLKKKVFPMDVNEGITELPEWRVIETPGHSPGHISLFLPLNTTLIAGDAFATTKAESAIYVFADIKKLSGPPMYFTPDWEQAAKSVRKLADLQPRIVAAGHGPVMRGREMQLELQNLADNFAELAVPGSGRYVCNPVIAGESGIIYTPPFKSNVSFKVTVIAIAAVLTGFIAARQLSRKLG